MDKLDYTDEGETREEKFSIVRLKLNILPKNCTINNVYKSLTEKFESSAGIKYQEDTNQTCFAKFSKEVQGNVENMIYYTTNCKCQFITRSVVPGEDDDVKGDMTFFYWENDGIKLYANVKSGKSSTWALLSRYRDCQFPKRFAITFLNPKCIKEKQQF